MTHVPALREALQDAAQRRYGRGRRRWGRLLIAAPIAGATAMSVVLVRSPSPERVVDAPPAPTVRTIKITPLPTPEPITGPPLVVRSRPLDDAGALFEKEGGTRNGSLEQAWATPGMQGEAAHVFFFRRGSQRCLSVPDPGGLEPGDRGVTCSSAKVFQRFGVSLTIGSNYAAVVPDPGRPPIYRRADGTRERLQPVSGLIALARTEAGSAVALVAHDGSRRTDGFRADQRQTTTPHNRYECSDGESVLVPTAIRPDEDPCTAMAAQRRRSTTPLPDRPARGG